MPVYIAVDTGGTFTDLVAFDSERREISYTKSLTTHESPIAGILDCIRKTRTPLARASLFKHGTTLVINTLLERSGPRIALVTTRGFRDIVELGRGNRSETFNLRFRRDPPLVRRQDRHEIEERIDGQGNVLKAPDRREVEAIAERLRTDGPAAVAVSFVNSYLDPLHERQVAGWLRELLPDCFVTAGTDLTREWHEYERTCTATANAYAGPKIGRYVAALQRGLAERGFAGKLLLMGSSGGVLSVAHASAAPVALVESGPVGGCIGAGVFGRALGLDNLIAFDMGGTTAKCALVRNGEFDVESTYYAGGYGKGVPIRAAVLDIVEVGAGGGSIAWLDAQGQLKLGPQSAGSMPGPVCYGRGGTQPTVTDANLLLGRLGARSFQGGEMTLDESAAAVALQTLARPLGYSGDQGVARLASGILEIAAVKMGEAIKRVTVQRGQDPRDFVLFAYGGGGPLHAAQLARELGIPAVVVPPEPGNFSATGMLLADVRRELGRTLLARVEPEGMDRMAAVAAELAAELRHSAASDVGTVEFERFADIRFVGQFHSVRLPVSSRENADALLHRFRAAYRARFGHASESAAAEVVAVHCVLKLATDRPEVERLFRAAPSAARAPRSRRVFHPELARFIDTPVLERESLRPGFALDGPVVIEEYGSTTVAGPQDRVEVGRLGELRLSVAAKRA